MSTPAPHVPRRAASPGEDRVPSPMPTPVSITTQRSVEAPTPGHPRIAGILPHFRVRLGGIVAFADLAVALLSLYLPWVSGSGGASVTAIVVTEFLDLRAMMPINFLGLIVLSELGAITLATLLGFVALLNAAVAPRVLVALCAFVWVLFGSTGSTGPLISSLPAGNSVTYGPYVSALGFLLVIAARRSTGARVSTDTPPPPGGRQGWGHGWGGRAVGMKTPASTAPATGPAPRADASATADLAVLPPGPVTSAELAAAVLDSRDRARYRRIWRGMYRRADQPDDLRLRAVALARSWPEGVLRGRSAALLWGDDSAPGDSPPEIWLPATRRAVPGRVYRYGALPPSAVTEVDGLRVTTPLRTCRDLTADLPHEDAVVALDRMCAADPGLEGLLRAATAHPSGSGSGALAEVLRDLEPRAGSPDEARARLVLHAAGHRGFVHGHEVEVRRRRTVPSLADTDSRVAVEVRSGRESVDERARDGRTWAALRRAGWMIHVVRTDPDAEPTPGPAPGPDVGSVSAALRARWPATDVLEPLVADATADPLGWWARPA